MVAWLALICVIIEIGALLYGLFVPEAKLFYALAVYGSPIHLLMNRLGAHAELLLQFRFYYSLIAFHVIKYGALIKGRIDEAYGGVYIPALIGEAAYLAYCGYTLYS